MRCRTGQFAAPPFVPLLLLASTAACGGCAPLRAGLDEGDAYRRARREIEQPIDGVRPASFEPEDPAKEAKSRWEDLSPKNIAETAKKWAGYGPDPKLAEKWYGEAESLYNQALHQQNADRSSSFLAAGELYRKAAGRWPDSALEEHALFRVGECRFFADRYPKANEAYEELLKKHPHTRYLDLVEARRFAIAQYWLKLHETHPQPYLSYNFTDRSRPRHDTFGRSLKIFDRVRFDDPTGKLADDATLAAGNASFKAGDYLKADEFYTDLRKTFPSSEHQFLAHLLGLKSKLYNYQGPDYSGDALDQAEKLIEQIRKQFPNEAQQHRDYLARAYAEVRYRKAERVWTRACYHDRRHEYGAARFHYDLILNDHPDTPFAERARQRLEQLRGKPDVPPQRLSWLVNLFPDPEPPKPLVAASQPAGAK
jgi:tetratricopeptide (TPR) repeat protein